VDSRSPEQGDEIRRRRECIKCKFRFSTIEKIEIPKFMVKKREGGVEAYDRDKLVAGLQLAFEKRPVKNSELLKIISIVEQDLQDRSEPQIDSTEIGTLVLDQLKRIDEVAYMRFASVHKSFESAEHFKEELDNLN